LLQRDGAIGISGAGAEMVLADLELWPGGIVEVPSPAQEKSTLVDRLKARPTMVGYQVPVGGAMLLKGRTISAVGERKITIALAGNPPVREIVVAGKSHAD